MVDIAFGPEPGPRPDLKDPREAYLEMVRRKRMYGGIIMVLFVAFMASGWMLADAQCGWVLGRAASGPRLSC
jgi:phosphonate transport system permease protein